MRHLYSDFRYALRTLRKSPLFTAIALASIALGIGANTAIFTIVDQVLLRLLPVKNPRELVVLASKGATIGSNRGSFSLSHPMYRDLLDHNQVFTGMICRYGFGVQIGFQGQTSLASAELVSGNYFEVLGVAPALGRLFSDEDDKTPGGHPLVVLSNTYWRNYFNSNSSVIGRDIVVNGQTLTVIGVSQPGFDGLDIGNSAQLFIPILMKAQMTPTWNDLDNRRSTWLNAFGRLRPGITLEQAQASLVPLYQAIRETEVKAITKITPYALEQFRKGAIEVQPGSQGRPSLQRFLDTPLKVLMCIVAVVLLIACANVANLLLARATARQKEIAVRLSLGASRGRLVSQLLVESFVLSILGGIAGLAFAYATARYMLTFAPPEVPLTFSATPDLRILAFNFAISIVTGLIFGLFPALSATRSDLANSMKDTAAAVVGGSGNRFRKTLVVAQVALSLLLLITAGLFVRSLQHLKDLSPGFKTDNLIAFNVDASLNGYSAERIKSAYKQLTDEIRSFPGVKAAAFAAVPLLADSNWQSTISVEGYEAKPSEDRTPNINTVSPGYFATIELPLVAGREFTLQDQQPETHVAVVNQAFVKRFFGTRNPIGRLIGFGGAAGTPLPIEIVGVAADAKYANLKDEIRMQVFLPYLEERRPTGMTAYVRTATPPEQAFASIREVVRRLEPNLPIRAMRTMETQINMNLILERFVASLSSAFGTLATILALIGLYGVMSYMVARRTREIGIRMALGAYSGSIVRMVMREVLLLIAIGVGIGFPAALAAARLVQSQLFGITASDPLTLAAATTILSLVAAAAGFLPARRASRTNPVRALRYE